MLDSEPPVGEWFRIISDESQPVIFLPRGDPIWFGEDTCEGSVGVLNEGRSEHTDGSLSLFVVEFGHVMSPLILKVGYTDVRIRKKSISCWAYFHR